MSNTEFRYSCTQCNFYCNKVSHWKSHTSTRKHIINQSSEQSVQVDIDTPNISIPLNTIELFNPLECRNCGMIYKAKSSLWYHEKKCNNKEDIDDEHILTVDTLNEIVKQNQDLRQIIINFTASITQPQPPTVINNITNHHSTNNSQTNNSNHFNLQVFLNEHCKDAMNLNEFIAGIKVDMDDIEYLGEVGYVDGMSTVIVRHINDTEVHKRPMHCTDLKREVIYVKNDNKWTKEGASHENMQKIVNNTYHKNKRAIANWVRDTDPNIARDVTHPLYTKYIRLLSKSLGGYDPQEHNMFSEKIIRNVARGILIDKEMQQ